ncbi:hypothetical protein TYRP_015034 [Tyrophagus putrescentiae]|nr:hypothetical protein TYRP_015034 [Tyrophagus putrescentiae]
MKANRGGFDDHNYYDAVLYESVGGGGRGSRGVTSKAGRFRLLIIGVAACLLLLVIILSGVLLWKFIISPSKQPISSSLVVEQKFCTDLDDKPAELLACRRSFVRNMTLSAFSAYRNYVWGAPEFEPVNLEPFTNTNAGTYPGLTIVDAMSTLWVMDLKEEWSAGREWIATKLHFADLDQVVRVREAFMDYLGGLLSAYALSGEQVFLEKAKEVYKALGPAFYESTGMLAFKFNPKVKSSSTTTGNSSEAIVKVKKVKLSLKAAVRFINGSHTVVVNNNGTSGPLRKITELPVLKSSSASSSEQNTTAYDHERQSGNFIANIGFQQPEFIYIANLTGDRVMVGRLEKSRELIKSIQRPKGLYMTRVDASTGAAISIWGSLFDVATDFYYNALRSYLQLGSWDEELLEMYGEAMDAAIRADLFKVIGGRLYLRTFNTKTQLHAYGMEDTGCLVGGMLALSSAAYQRAGNKERWRLHLGLAVNITETCHHEANSTATKLLPNKFILGKVLSNETWIAPDLAETYFILYRLTGDGKYREWAWELAQAFYRHCRTTSGGFSDLKTVNSVPTVKSDYQRANFLSGTLKYLYLIFTDDTSSAPVLPLDKWIFNTRGHPLPVCGSSVYYSKDKCER